MYWFENKSKISNPFENRKSCNRKSEMSFPSSTRLPHFESRAYAGARLFATITVPPTKENCSIKGFNIMDFNNPNVQCLRLAEIC